MRIHRAVPLLAVLLPAVAQAQDQPNRAFLLFQGLWFFAVMIVATIVLAALRIRDARAGLPEAERKARMQKRLPIALGALVVAIVPLLMR